MGAQYSSLAEKHLAVSLRSGDEWMCRCPFHDDSNASLQFNVAKGLFICFACGARGNAKKLQRHLGIRWSEGEIDVADIRAKLDLLKAQENALAQVVLDESYLDRYRFDTTYWASRGFTPETVAAFDLGCDPLGDSYGAYATIPVRSMLGDLLGVIKRYLEPNAELRYRYPKGFHRQQNLFASWMVEHDPEADIVALTEGSVDAMKVWQAGVPAVACYGNSISPQQIRVLRKLGISQVVIFADNDRGGADLTSRAQGYHPHRNPRTGKLIRWEYRPQTDLTRDFIVRKVSYDGIRAKDPGTLDERQVRLMLRRARNVL